jgi:hypothetical protein
MPKQAGEFRPGPLAPQLVLHGPLAELLEWQALAEGASPNPFAVMCCCALCDTPSSVAAGRK